MMMIIVMIAILLNIVMNMIIILPHSSQNTPKKTRHIWIWTKERSKNPITNTKKKERIGKYHWLSAFEQDLRKSFWPQLKSKLSASSHQIGAVWTVSFFAQNISAFKEKILARKIQNIFHEKYKILSEKNTKLFLLLLLPLVISAEELQSWAEKMHLWAQKVSLQRQK